MIEQETTVNRRYRVDRLVGEGGMAVVYRGHDLLLGRDVAIKALRPQFAADPAFRTRFQREAQAAAGFAHPHIIDIYDVGEEDGTPYIVMEFVQGQTLKEIIDAEGPFHPDDVAALLEQVGAALDYAHERGYVHRDVKPQNILVDGRGLARVVDFGIAKGLADADLTEVGTGLGTVHYLSPEQASGLMATPASDIYSLGVVAFEMLTRRLPFEADSAVGVAMRHVHDEPPRPSSVLPSIPAAVDAIVLRALAKDPTRRFTSAGALARAMGDWRHYLSAGGDPVPSVPARSRAARVAANGGRTPGASSVPDTIPMPRRPATAPNRARAIEARRPVQPRPVQRDEVGCVTWAVGIAILAGLIGLIWLGFRLSPRLADLSGVADLPTTLPEPTRPALADQPSVAEQTTDEPTIAPAPAAGRVAVPDLTGMTLDEATDAVNARGLLLAQTESVFSEAVPVDAVAEQDPPAETPIDQGSTVYVKLSRGSPRVDLRALDLVGRAPDEAEALLRAQDLGVVREEVPSRDVPPGGVVGTDPANHATVGDTVVLQVSAGDRVRIPPEIQGQPLDQVARQLERLGLRVGNRFPVDRATIERFGIDLAAAGIGDQDVVGVQGEGVDFGAWVTPGTSVDLVYYDRGLDRA